MNPILFSMIFLSLTVFGINSQSKKNCDLNENDIHSAFIIKNVIYFGNDKFYYSLNLDNYEIRDKRNIKEIFGNSQWFHM